LPFAAGADFGDGAGTGAGGDGRSRAFGLKVF
jgi:hypothetical protein